VKSQYLAFDVLLISSRKGVVSRSKNKDETSCLTFSGTGLSSIVADGSVSVTFRDLSGDKDA